MMRSQLLRLQRFLFWALVAVLAIWILIWTGIVPASTKAMEKSVVEPIEEKWPAATSER